MTYDIQHDTLSLFIPRIDPRRVIWNGRGSTLVEALEKYDVDEVHYVDELGDAIRDWSTYYSGSGSDIYVLHSGQVPDIPGLHAIIDSKSLQPAMNAARMIKDNHEIGLIRKANDISSVAHKEVLANILKFKNEAQVEGLFMDVCISHQAKQQAYDPIAASGPNAGTLHYDANNEDFVDRQLMCLDAGCEYELYASDITRTFPLAESWPSKEAENIYKLVERMQESCIERLAPGVRYLDLHILAHQIAIDGLLKLDILHNGTREEIYNAGTSRAFFPHGLGHHVGLEVHDVGQAELMSVRRGKGVAYQAPSLFPQDFYLPVYDPATCHAPTDAQSSQLEEGMVVTVEPGIYFSVYALKHFYLPSPVHSRFINQKVLQRYLPVGGVRIEDDILITSKGYENLTTAPKGSAMFDIIRGNGAKLEDRTQQVPAAAHAEAHRLCRAPGISLATSPPGLRQLTRAPTTPNHIPHGQSRQVKSHDAERSPSDFRRSMTTDERIQCWRQSRQPSTPPKSAGTKLATICGASSTDVKHSFITADSAIFPQDQQLPHCTQCTLLANALDRLRESLNRSEQGARKQPQLTPSRDSICDRPAPCGFLPRPIATCPVRNSSGQVHQQRAEEQRQLLSTHNSPTSPHEKLSSEEPITRASVSYPSLSQLADPTDLRTYLPSNEALEQQIEQDPANFYRQSLSERPTEYNRRFAGVDLSRYSQTQPNHAATVDASIPQSRIMPVRTRRIPDQGLRRTSNHTDDRDWMA